MLTKEKIGLGCAVDYESDKKTLVEHEQHSRTRYVY